MTRDHEALAAATLTPADLASLCPDDSRAYGAQEDDSVGWWGDVEALHPVPPRPERRVARRPATPQSKDCTPTGRTHG